MAKTCKDQCNNVFQTIALVESINWIGDYAFSLLDNIQCISSAWTPLHRTQMKGLYLVLKCTFSWQLPKAMLMHCSVFGFVPMGQNFIQSVNSSTQVLVHTPLWTWCFSTFDVITHSRILPDVNGLKIKCMAGILHFKIIVLH